MFKTSNLLPIAALLFVGINLLRQKSTDIRFLRYKLLINQGRPAIEIQTQVFNPSNLPLIISDINFQVLIDNKLIGNIIPMKRYSIPSRKTTNLNLILDLTGGGAALITAISKLSNGIDIRGSYKAHGINQNINERVRL
jgi:hypothetical protein